MVIGLGADHAGFSLKEKIKEYLLQKGLQVKDFGTYNDSPCDYPDYGKLVAGSISKKECQFGILICGTGIGMSIVANRFPKIRAALCLNREFAELARKHNDANILCLPGRFLEERAAFEIVSSFLTTEFEGLRHKTRVEKLGSILT